MRRWIDLIAESESYPLYHGTSLFRACLMLDGDMMRGCNQGDQHLDPHDDEPFCEVGVSFSRGKATAADFALQTALDSAYDLDDFRKEEQPMQRDDSCHTAVLEFDAADLHRSFDVAREGFNKAQQNEQEERVLGNLTNLSRHLRRVHALPQHVDQLERVLKECLEVLANGDDEVAKRDCTAALRGLSLLRKYV